MPTWTDPYINPWMGNESTPANPPLHADQRDHHIAQLQFENNSLRQGNAQLRADVKYARTQKDELHKALETLTRGTGGIMPQYSVQDRFTVCTLFDPVAERFFTGVTRANPTDKFDRSIGEAISFGRAAKNRADYWASAAFAR